MRADRLVALLLHVHRHQGATAAELARVLEVSVRTVYRDVAALQAAGVPLWTEPGPKGGVRLVEGWRPPVEGLTADEAGALFLTGVPGAAAELGLGAVMATAQVKLLATLPAELRARAHRVRERFHLDAPGWFRRAEATPHVEPIARAVWEERRLDLAYGRDPEPLRRRVDPLGLVLKSGTWYLVAAHRAGAEHGSLVRTYRLGRVRSVEVLDERFERPPQFSLAEWWAQSSADFDRSILRLDVRLRLGPRAAALAPHVLMGVPVAAALAAAPPPDASGWREVVLPLESEDVAADQLPGLGPEVEVLAPATLRARLAAIGVALAALNAGAGPTG